MHISTLFALLPLIAGATAFKIPDGQSDGVYVAYYDADGNEVHKPLIKRGPVEPPKGALSARQQWDPSSYGHEMYCGCGFNMDHPNCDSAVAALKAQLPAYIPLEASYYSIANDAVAFACNRSKWNPFWLTVDMVTQSAGDITAACGLYVAGTDLWYQFIGYGEPPDEWSGYVGYMQYSSGLDFCGHADGSSSTRC